MPTSKFMAVTCGTINQIFETETGRFSIDIWDRYQVDSPWGRLTRVGKFPQGMGTSINEETIERVLSGSFEGDWTNVSSGGLSTAGCQPAPVDLSFGNTVRNWTLQTKSYQTPCICLDQLKTAFQIENQVAKTVDQLTQLSKTVLDNRRRTSYMQLVPMIQSGYNTEYTGGINTVPPPTYQLSQDQLDELRVRLIRDGAGHNCLGRENGAPVLGLIVSPQTSRALLRNNPDLRKDINYATPSELLAPLGVDRSFGGYYHMADFEVPRFTYSGGAYTQIYPFIQMATTQGFAWNINPAYDAAPYELAYIYHPDVYEEAVQQVGPNIKGAAFEDYPYYYSGEFFWLNIRDTVTNPLGKIGSWLSIFQSGVRPINPTLGRTILFRRCENDFSQTACVYS